ncbi:hypothetical protein GCM10022214_27390 [Actinomadura miaoliensis]|uniref:MFS transporter n=1 Tax=Actinomadura miaoliensis TaxID=430685 RepID=A0ABP7VMA1_9ACTN
MTYVTGPRCYRERGAGVSLSSERRANERSSQPTTPRVEFQRDRAKAFDVYGAVSAASGGLGLLLDGALTTNLSWRWRMYIHLIFAAIAIIARMLLAGRQQRASAADDQRLLSGSCSCSVPVVAWRIRSARAVAGVSPMRADGRHWRDQTHPGRNVHERYLASNASRLKPDTRRRIGRARSVASSMRRVSGSVGCGPSSVVRGASISR